MLIHCVTVVETFIKENYTIYGIYLYFDWLLGSKPSALFIWGINGEDRRGPVAECAMVLLAFPSGDLEVLKNDLLICPLTLFLCLVTNGDDDRAGIVEFNLSDG